MKQNVISIMGKFFFIPTKVTTRRRALPPISGSNLQVQKFLFLILFLCFLPQKLTSVLVKMIAMIMPIVQILLDRTTVPVMVDSKAMVLTAKV